MVEPKHSIKYHFHTFQDFYATFDLVESAVRMWVVHLAKPLMAELEPITSLAQLDKLTDKLIAQFNNWEKYAPGIARQGMHACPDLSSAVKAKKRLSAGAVKARRRLSAPGTTRKMVELHVAPEAPPMVDIPNDCFKKARVDPEPASLVFGEVEEEAEAVLDLDRAENGHQFRSSGQAQLQEGLGQLLEEQDARQLPLRASHQAAEWNSRAECRGRRDALQHLDDQCTGDVRRHPGDPVHQGQGAQPQHVQHCPQQPVGHLPASDTFEDYMKGYLQFFIATTHLGSLLDFVYYGAMLLAAKQITRRGDGRANLAIWRLHLTDFYVMGHVSIGLFVKSHL